MKAFTKILGITLSVALLLTCMTCAVLAKGANLVVGGDFDSMLSEGVVTLPTGWLFTQPNKGENPPFVPLNSLIVDRPDGTGKCLRLTGPYHTTGGLITLTLNGLNPESTYEISYDSYCVLEGGTGSGGYTQSNSDPTVYSVTVGGTLQSKIFRRMPNANGRIALNFMNHPNAGATTVTYWDNLSICELSDMEARNLVANGSMENGNVGELPAGYTVYTVHANYGAAAITTDEARTGSKSLYFENASVPRSSAAISFGSLPAGTYRLSYQAKGANVSVAAAPDYTTHGGLSIKSAWCKPLLGGGSSPIGVVNSSYNTTTWTWEDIKDMPWAECSDVFTISAAQACNISFLRMEEPSLAHFNALPAYIDDLSLVRLDGENGAPVMGLYNKYNRSTANFYENIEGKYSDTTVAATKKGTATVGQAVLADLYAAEANESALLLAAQYTTVNGTQQLVDITLQNKTATIAGEVLHFNQDITLDASTEYVKLMLWKSGTVAPYCKSVAVR